MLRKSAADDGTTANNCKQKENGTILKDYSERLADIGKVHVVIRTSNTRSALAPCKILT